MNRKLIIVSTTHSLDHVDTAPQSFVVELTEAHRQRITQLSQAQQELGCDAVEDSFNSGTWSMLSLDELDDPECATTAEPAMAFARQAQDSAVLPIVPMVRVTYAHVQFTMVPPGCNEDLLVSTERIPLTEIDTDQLLLIKQ